MIEEQFHVGGLVGDEPQRPHIVTVPGFNSDGEYMLNCHTHWQAAGYKTFHFGYNKEVNPATRLLTRWRNERVVEELRQFLVQLGGRVILVGHSNGASVTRGLLWRWQGAKDRVVGVVTVNAALDRDTDIPAWLPYWHNWYSKDDWVLLLARFRPWHDWGALGRTVYEGDYLNMENFDMADLIPYAKVGHSTVLTRPTVAEDLWPQIISEAVHDGIGPRPVTEERQSAPLYPWGEVE